MECLRGKCDSQSSQILRLRRLQSSAATAWSEDNPESKRTVDCCSEQLRTDHFPGKIRRSASSSETDAEHYGRGANSRPQEGTADTRKAVSQHHPIDPWRYLAVGLCPEV